MQSFDLTNEDPGESNKARGLDPCPRDPGTFSEGTWTIPEGAWTLPERTWTLWTLQTHPSPTWASEKVRLDP